MNATLGSVSLLAASATAIGETRKFSVAMVARCHGKGPSFAQNIIPWEIEWMEGRKIGEGRRGCYMKTRSWFEDEGVIQAVRDWLGR